MADTVTSRDYFADACAVARDPSKALLRRIIE
jgi:hypothetical protein